MYRSSMWSLGDAHFVDLPSIQCHRNDLCSYRFDATDHELNRTIICYKLNHCIEDDDFTLGVCIRCFPARRQFEQCFSYFDTGYAMLKKLCKAPTPINRRFTKEWESVLEASGFPLDKYSLLRFIYSAPCVPNQLSQAARRMPATGCYYENKLATHPYTESIRRILKVSDQLIMNPTRNKYLPFRLNSCTSFLMCQHFAVFDSTSKQGIFSRKRPGAPFQNTCSL